MESFFVKLVCAANYADDLRESLVVGRNLVRALVIAFTRRKFQFNRGTEFGGIVILLERSVCSVLTMKNIVLES